MTRRFKVPDLSTLGTKSPLLALERMFRGGGPSDPIVYGLTMNFVRLADSSLQSYERGRLALEDYMDARESGGLDLSSFLIATSSFEQCMESIKRAINFLKAIRGSIGTPQALKDALPRPIGILSGRVEGVVTGMRDAIQHLEGDIQGGAIVSGDPLALMPVDDAVELGVMRITYSDLSGWVHELNQLAEIVARFHEPT